VSRLAKETGVDKFCRTFSAWSHVVAMLYAQFSHSIGLNDVCDALRLNSGPLSAIRGAKPPSRNGLSHAGKQRKAVLAEKLFWGRISDSCKKSWTTIRFESKEGPCNGRSKFRDVK
jgi:hypothetical protein